MRKSLLLVTLLGGLALPGRAADHLVTEQVRSERLESAAAQRQLELGSVREVLAQPAAAQVAGRLGVDLSRVRAGVATLSDSELHDLAQRAQNLSSVPTSALDGDLRDLLVIFLIVAIVILVLQAVD